MHCFAAPVCQVRPPSSRDGQSRTPACVQPPPPPLLPPLPLLFYSSTSISTTADAPTLSFISWVDYYLIIILVITDHTPTTPLGQEQSRVHHLALLFFYFCFFFFFVIFTSSSASPLTPRYDSSSLATLCSLQRPRYLQALPSTSHDLPHINRQ